MYPFSSFSGLRESGHWLSKVNEKGEIFELEVEPLQDTSGEKDCLCTCSDCATDDTGYGTDSEVTLNRLNDDADDDFDEESELLNKEIDDYVAVNSSAVDIQSIEENIDSLFTSVNSTSQFDTLKTDSLDLTGNISDLFVDLPEINAVHSNLCAEITDKKNKTMTNPESVSKSVKNRRSKLPDESAGKRLNDTNCSCSSKETVGVEGNTGGSERTVILRLKYQNSDVATNTVELCEQLLGIVPGHFSSTNEIRGRRRDKRIKIRGLVPTGVSAKQSEIKVGEYIEDLYPQGCQLNSLRLKLVSVQRTRTHRGVS